MGIENTTNANEGPEQKTEMLSQLEAERDSLDSSYIYARNLLEKEIEKVKTGSTGESNFIEGHSTKPTKISVKVLLPVKQYPKYNFVGKLLGPGGNTLKGMQQQTMTRMAIQGRGSMRDKQKEEELRQQGGPKNAHLNEELHLQIEAFSGVGDAYHRIGDALEAVKPYICPELNDDTVNRAQMEMAGFTPGLRGRGRGRVSSLLSSPVGRGGPPPAASMDMGYDEYSGGYGDAQGYDYGADPYTGAAAAAPAADNYYSFGGRGGGAPGRAKVGGWGGAPANGGPKAPPMGRGRGERVHPYGGGAAPRGRGRPY
jgi:hypothetical protein